VFGAAKGAASTVVDGFDAVVAATESVLDTGAVIIPAVMFAILGDGFIGAGVVVVVGRAIV